MSSYVDKTQQDKTQQGTHPAAQRKEDNPAFTDNRTEAIAQRELQADINKSDRVQQFKAYQELADNYTLKTAPRFDPVQKKENNTGLPDNLKTGIENLSNYSMDDVKVHYNSNKPGELQAHAYAQGTDIHIAAGQERHLPHEAWHVVQQKQGRVKATMQMKGEMAVNDDPALESEADLMGTAAMSLTQETDIPLQLKSTSGSPLTQFLFKEFKNDKDSRETAVVKARETIEEAVIMARAFSLNWSHLENHPSPRISQWYTTANRYFNNPLTPLDFLYTQFGYAVETIACNNIPGTLHGLTVDFQITSGSTRPDIVLTSGTDQVAWIDITSTASENHIRTKHGSGWSTKPYVYEVFYNALDPADVLQGMSNPLLAESGEYLANSNKITTEEENIQQQKLTDILTKLQLDRAWQTGVEDRKKKKEITQTVLRNLGMNLGSQNVKAAKGALALVEINPGPFGFDDGKQDTTAASKWVTAAAAPRGNERKTAARSVKINELATFLEPYSNASNPLARAWFNSIHALTDERVDREIAWTYDDRSVLRGVATKHVLEKHRELNDTDQFYPHAGNDLVARYLNLAAALQHQYLTDYEFNNYTKYVDEAMKLIDHRSIVMSTIETQTDFSLYLTKKYQSVFSTATTRERHLMDALLDFPQNLDAQEAAQNYLEENPIEKEEEEEEENGQMFFGADGEEEEVGMNEAADE